MKHLIANGLWKLGEWLTDLGLRIYPLYTPTPDLLEASKKVVHNSPISVSQHSIIYIVSEEEMDALRDAIAKAESSNAKEG